ncbi:MAG: DNA gyrase subunit A, partial [Prochlorotrichaceae cyanobacterium]
KMADLANANKVQGIADIRDESDREGMRVVIELKREANPAQLLADLYQKTPLQVNFGATLLGIVNGEPRQLSLKGLLQEFLDFREETLTRRYRYELDKAQNRLEIVEGLLTALEQLDLVIEILRHAPDGSTAKARLQVRLDLSDRQTDAILAMPLRRLITTERTSLEQEAQELRDSIQTLERLLNDRHELLKSLKKDLRALKRKYANPRRTRIYEAGTEPTPVLEFTSSEDDTPEETIVEYSQRGYLRRFAPRSRQRQKDDGPKDKPGQWQTLSDLDDFVLDQQTLQSNQELLVISRGAKAYTLAVGDIPLQRRQGKGVPLVTLLPEELQGNPSQILWTTPLPEACENKELIALTQGAKIKRLPLGDFQNLTQRGLILMKLKEADELLWLEIVDRQNFVVVGTSSGRVLRFDLNDEQLPLQGRNTQGQTVLRLRTKEQLVGGAVVSPADHLIFMSEKGYGKRLLSADLPLGCRGDLGNTAFHFSRKGDRLISLQSVQADDELILLSSQNRITRLPVAEIPLGQKNSRDITAIVSLQKGENLERVLKAPRNGG